MSGSPSNGNPDLERWFDAQNHPLAAVMRRARDVILDADPRVRRVDQVEDTFDYEGNIASLNPSKKFVSIMFHRGAEIPGNHPRLEGDGKLVRTTRFSSLDQVEAAAGDLQTVVRAWCNSRPE